METIQLVHIYFRETSDGLPVSVAKLAADYGAHSIDFERRVSGKPGLEYSEIKWINGPKTSRSIRDFLKKAREVSDVVDIETGASIGLA